MSGGGCVSEGVGVGLLAQVASSAYLAKMVLGEAFIKDILRPPPTGFVPDNVPHPFQKSFYTYVTKRALPRHWFLLAGFTFAVTLYGTLDKMRELGKQKAYDEAVLAGKQPCGLMR